MLYAGFLTSTTLKLFKTAFSSFTRFKHLPLNELIFYLKCFKLHLNVDFGELLNTRMALGLAPQILPPEILYSQSPLSSLRNFLHHRSAHSWQWGGNCLLVKIFQVKDQYFGLSIQPYNYRQYYYTMHNYIYTNFALYIPAWTHSSCSIANLLSNPTKGDKNLQDTLTEQPLW